MCVDIIQGKTSGWMPRIESALYRCFANITSSGLGAAILRSLGSRLSLYILFFPLGGDGEGGGEKERRGRKKSGGSLSANRSVF